MAGTTFKKRDMNRYRRTYPYLRKHPRYSYCADKEVVIEVETLIFSSTPGPITHTFNVSFPGIPTITVTSVDSNGNNGADVNVFVSSVSQTQVTIEASHQFDGTVDLHAIWIGS
tara:strand:+ start:1812 stop:2153 length:342 start_codon:yes stop_codon:yes gene_type:complete